MVPYSQTSNPTTTTMNRLLFAIGYLRGRLYTATSLLALLAARLDSALTPLSSNEHLQRGFIRGLKRGSR